jgi:hypothetical protein
MRFVSITDENKKKICINLDNVQFVTVKEEKRLVDNPSGLIIKGEVAKEETSIYSAIIALNGLVINKVFKEEKEAWKYLEDSITQA